MATSKYGISMQQNLIRGLTNSPVFQQYSKEEYCKGFDLIEAAPEIWVVKICSKGVDLIVHKGE